MKKIIIVLLIILLVISGLMVIKNTAARIIVSKATQQLTGLRLSMQSIKLGILKGLIDITGLKIYNPQGYPDKIMADFPVIYVNCNLGALIKGKTYLPQLRLHLKELNIIKNSEGRLNISSIKTVGEQKEKEGKAPPIQIDSLQLKIGKVVYKDYSSQTPPVIKEFDIDLDEKYENITNLRTLVNLIIAKALKKTAIDQLANFDLSIITDRLPPGLKEGARVVTKGAAEVKKVAQEGVKSAKETVKETTEKLKGIFEIPLKEKEGG